MNHAQVIDQNRKDTEFGRASPLVRLEPTYDPSVCEQSYWALYPKLSSLGQKRFRERGRELDAMKEKCETEGIDLHCQEEGEIEPMLIPKAPFVFLPDGSAVIPAPVPPSTENQMIEQRREKYGDPAVNWDATALHFTAIIRQWLGKNDFPVIPASIAALFPVAMKLSRLAKTPTHEDSHVDIPVYLKISKELAKGAT